MLVCRYPVYDDHFDIRAEQHLLGKTLVMLGKAAQPGTTLSLSLQVKKHLAYMLPWLLVNGQNPRHVGQGRSAWLHPLSLCR
jgi:hypothetical protein